MSAIVTVTPRAVATYQAVRLESDEDYGLIGTLAELVGARALSWTSTRRKGQVIDVLRIIGKNRKTYDLAMGDWLVILGTNGSIRVCSDKQYKKDYKEAKEA